MKKRRTNLVKNKKKGKNEEKKIINIDRFELIKTQFRLKGDPFDFTNKDYLKPIINRSPGKMMMKTARQVEKSTTVGNRSLSNMISKDKYKVTYVTPINKQAKEFSKDRMIPLIKTSPFVKHGYASTSNTSLAVNSIKLDNFSTLNVRSTFGTGADSIRGLSNDELDYDEVQDIDWDDIPIINECLSHSQYVNEFGGRGTILYTGTPKTLDNTIESLWQASTQTVLTVKCPFCNSHLYGGGEKNIDKNGFLCTHCGRTFEIGDQSKFWVSSFAKDNERQIEGFHLSQLMMPWINWNSILNKYQGKDSYPIYKFYNEVLGLSYDNSEKIFTLSYLQGILIRNENEDSWDKLQGTYSRQGQRMYMGVDWGTGTVSFTIITLLVRKEGKYIPIWIKKFHGNEGEGLKPLDLIKTLMRQYPGIILGLDYGAGFFMNTELMEAFGPDRVKIFYHSNSNYIIKYSETKRIFVTDRTDVMTKFFTAIKRGDYQFRGSYEMYEEFFPDFIAINLEYNTSLRKYVYTHKTTTPDDAVHSGLYAYLTGEMDGKFLVPLLAAKEEK